MLKFLFCPTNPMNLHSSSDLVVAAVVAEVLLLKSYAHHGGEDEERTTNADGVWPDAHEHDLAERRLAF